MKVTHSLAIIALLLEQFQSISASCGQAAYGGCLGIAACFERDQEYALDCDVCWESHDCAEDYYCHGIGMCINEDSRIFNCADTCSSCFRDEEELSEIFYCGCEAGEVCIGEYFCDTHKMPEYYGVCIPWDREGNSPCLSAVSTVQVRGSGVMNVGDLKLGDLIATTANDNGEVAYQEIYAFGHLNHYSAARFLQIETNDVNGPLEITVDHLLFKYEASCSDVAGGVPVRADNLQVGDFIISDVGKKELVTGISTIERPGIFSPVVRSGAFLANGVKVSSYTTAACPSCSTDPQYLKVGNLRIISHHLLSHMATSPYRVLCNGEEGKSPCTDRNADGVLLFASFGEEWVSFVLEQGMVGSAFAALCFSFTILPLYALEQVLLVTNSASISVTIMFALFGMFCYFLYGSYFRKTRVM